MCLSRRQCKFQFMLKTIICVDYVAHVTYDSLSASYIVVYFGLILFVRESMGLG